MDSDHVRGQKVHRLAEHPGFRFDAADPPADNAETVDHGRVRIGADQRVGVKDIVFAQHALRQILQVDLMDDPNPRRDDREPVKGLHSPLEKLIAGAVALELDLHVQLECVVHFRKVHLHRMVHYQVYGDQRLNHARIASHAGDRRSHGRQIH